ncbi:hypothetical protein KS4_27910 [Poriferisphaera corsica]|uniref:Uncharacterized protein n=1 Tax=Poriferisphaera corsica TaxID=2528020 RepID=A0A517YWY9_9BACT|nr:hypothetical protein KS4_27910 [Poriferisphaera corsica]
MGFGILMLAVTALFLSGCRDPLFPKTGTRSPYQRYSELRGKDRGGYQQQDPTQPGKFERNLRQRLAPLGEVE